MTTQEISDMLDAKLDAKLNPIKIDNDRRFTEIEKTITALLDSTKELRSNIAHAFNKVNENFEKIDRRFESIDKKFELIDKRFDAIEGKIDFLQGNTSSNFITVDGKLDTLKDEIGKINDVTGYDAMYSNMKVIK